MFMLEERWLSEGCLQKPTKDKVEANVIQALTGILGAETLLFLTLN
jgi:hypothetical protein